MLDRATIEDIFEPTSYLGSSGELVDRVVQRFREVCGRPATQAKRNFSPGPSKLPAIAIERAGKDLIDFEGTGMSVVEQSHRSPGYERVQAEAIEHLRSLLHVPSSHEILLLGGSARGQFAMLAMNLLVPGSFANYLVTGMWSKAAYEEAALLGDARVSLDSRDEDGIYRRVPRPAEVTVDPAAAYVHLCSNNTIYGTQWHEFPDTGNVPLIADMTSDILSRPVDVSKFGMIYAATQKNLGPAGTVVVIVRKDLIERSRKDIPSVWRYAVHAKNASLYNTPTTFAVATMRHVLDYAISLGGVEAIDVTNREKARRLYEALDGRPDVYTVPAAADSRSLMNIVFSLKNTDAEARFLAEAKGRSMVGLKGHRSVGGVRASIYNWVTLEEVDALVDLIVSFEATGS